MIITVWLIVFCVLSFEYWALNFQTHFSLLLKLQHLGWISKTFLLTPDPGRPLSLYLGWLGLGIMILMNLYSLRKRISGLRAFGRLSDWLDFHVMCGLLGPTFIFFHSNFKVRGLVAISFWSMVISFTSGIIGRYFYLQLSEEKTDLETTAEKIKLRLEKKLANSSTPVTAEERERVMNMALAFAGVPSLVHELNPFQAIYYSVIGDFRLFFQTPFKPRNWPEQTQIILKSYALAKRRALFLDAFQRLMGYWHTFHFPFAVFMYVAAIIHVASALILGV